MKKILPYILSTIFTIIGMIAIGLLFNINLTGIINYIGLAVALIFFAFPAFKFWLSILKEKK